MHIIVSGKKREVADGLTVAQLLNSEKNDLPRYVSVVTKRESKDILQAQNPTIVADNGYDSITDVAQVFKDGMNPVVAGGDYEFLIETTAEDAETITDYTEGLAHAVYLPDRNIFVCPIGQVLYPSSFNKSKHIARYMNCKACSNCTHKCTVSNYYRAERRIKPSEFSKEYNDKELYLKRVQIRQNKEQELVQ